MSELERLAGEMEALLMEEASFLEEAAARLRRERKALISGEKEILEQAVERWQDLAEVRRERDRRRAVLLDRISTLTGLRPGEITASRVGAILSPATGGRLTRAGARLKAAARKAAVETAVGRDLLEEAARFHEGLLRSIGEAFQELGIAQGGPGGTEGPGISLLDARG